METSEGVAVIELVTFLGIALFKLLNRSEVATRSVTFLLRYRFRSAMSTNAQVPLRRSIVQTPTWCGSCLLEIPMYRLGWRKDLEQDPLRVQGF